MCEIFATSQEDLTNIIPYHAITGCDTVSDIAGHGNESAWNAFCSNPDLLAILSKGDFHDETYSSYPRSSSAGCSIFLMRAAMIMHGWLCLASAEYLKRCHLPTGNAPQLHIPRAHYQSPNDAYRGNLVTKTQTCTAQNRASAEPVTCMNNER